MKEKEIKLNFLENMFLGKEKEYFLENLSMLIASGMNISDALDAIESDISSKKIKKLIAQIKSDVNEGFPLWKTLDRSKIFQQNAISLIQIGEQTGKLSENLKIVQAQQKKDAHLKTKIKSAMTYPVFVISLTVIIGLGIAWFILPKLASVFGQLKIKLPLITKVLISAGIFLGKHGSIVVPISILVCIIIIYFIFYFPKTKIVGQRIVFRLPGIKDLIKQIEISRFGYILGTLVDAGLPIMQALGSLEKVATFPEYKKFYSYLKENIEQGDSFQKVFSSYKNIKKIFPLPIQQMIITAEKSGNLPETLIRISQDYEEKTEETTKNLTIILEPVLLIIVWLGVVGIALAVILPIYTLVGQLNSY